jgi:hypothetical protein
MKLIDLNLNVDEQIIANNENLADEKFNEFD